MLVLIEFIRVIFQRFSFLSAIDDINMAVIIIPIFNQSVHYAIYCSTLLVLRKIILWISGKIA